MMLSGSAFQQVPLAPLTAATGSGLLPTPEASNTKAVALRSGGRSPRNYLGPLWPTPRSSPNENRQTKPTPSQLAGKHGWSLGAAVTMAQTNAFKLGMTQKPSHSIPTPTASDHIERECTSTEALNFETNKSVTLDRWVKMWPTPAARDFRGANGKPFKDRGGGKKGEQLPNAVRHDPETPDGGQLNPEWVTWLMGFPPGWTEPMKAGKPSRKTRPE
jgi:hypothetical protein